MNHVTAGLLALLLPLGLGALFGLLLRIISRERIANLLGITGCLLLPPILWFIVAIWFPVVGLWDALTEGLLIGVGFAWTAHSERLDRRKYSLSIVSTMVGLILMEVAVRIFLGPPPSYSIGDGPHFLFKNVLRTTGPDSEMFLSGRIPRQLEESAMNVSPGGRGSMLERAPDMMVTREIVCSIGYGDSYESVIDISRDLNLVWPEAPDIRTDVDSRVLHVGDSLVAGVSEPRDRTFPAMLDQLEPRVQHVNGGIAGMAPDSYLVVLNSWAEREPFDLVVMYLFAGNDTRGIGAPHPCSNWESVLAYDHGRARLRYPNGPVSNNSTDLSWLVRNSPMPYLLRVLITQGSVAAAFIGAVQPLEKLAYRIDCQVQDRRLEMILKSVRDDFAKRGIPFVVVLLPSGEIYTRASEGPTKHLSGVLAESATRLDIPWLDATDMLRAAYNRGEDPVHSDRTHLNEVGHRLIARWLHESLPRLVPSKRAREAPDEEGE